VDPIAANRNPAIDGCRAIAVLIVIGFHCGVPWLAGGSLGVDVFFVISGFLITRLLAREIEEPSGINIARFYVKRLLRLSPPLLLMLIAYLAVSSLWPTSGDHALRDAFLAAFYLSDYSLAFWGTPDTLRHTWSLSVEEHYYLLWPVVLLVMQRMTGKGRILFLCALYILASDWRWMSVTWAGDWNANYFRFDTRVSGLIAGGLLALLVRNGLHLTGRNRDLVGFAGLATICLGVTLFRHREWPLILWGPTFVEIATLGLILSLVSGSDSWIYRLLSIRPFVFVGLISYGLYLWHFPLVAPLSNRWNWPWPIAVAVIVALSLVLATLSYVLVERPMQSLRHRLGQRPTPQLAGQIR